MIKIVFIGLLFIVQVISQFSLDFYDKDYCEYLRKDKIWLDKQMNDYNHFRHYDNTQFQELQDERKKIDQMIYQLCNNDKYEL